MGSVMHITAQQEEFSRAYVQAVSTVAGFAAYKPSVDDDSIDMVIAKKGGSGTFRSPRLEAQLKTHRVAGPAKGDFSFSIKQKNYDDLRIENPLVPRILIVVLLPNEVGNSIDHWIEQSEEELAMKHCGYWISLRGEPEKISSDKTNPRFTITIPQAQLFNVEQLRGIMQRIGEGKLP